MAYRELKIGAVLGDRELEYVVPVIDTGQDPDDSHYYIVMPICERSLQAAIDSGERPLSAIPDIVSGLIEVSDLVD